MSAECGVKSEEKAKKKQVPGVMIVEIDHIEQFLENLRRKGRHVVTVAEYAAGLREYAEYLAAQGQSSFFAASDSFILRYFTEVSNHPLARTTVWKKCHAVFAFYAWLKAQGQLLLNPCPRPATMRCSPLPREVPTWRGLQRLYGDSDTSLRQSAGIVDQRDFVIIDLAYACGLRRCELHNLDIADIDEEQGTLRVRGKGGRQRVVPIGPKTLVDLLHYLYHIRPQLCKQGATRALFVSWMQGGKRMHPYSINAAFNRLRKRGMLEKGITPHRLRHGFATDLIKNGAPVQDVSRMLGHVRLETTQVYTRLYPLDLKAHHTHHHPRG